jgi:hypothetical protein
MNNVVRPVIITTIWFSTHMGVPIRKLAERNKLGRKKCRGLNCVSRRS